MYVPAPMAMYNCPYPVPVPLTVPVPVPLLCGAEDALRLLCGLPTVHRTQGQQLQVRHRTQGQQMQVRHRTQGLMSRRLWSAVVDAGGGGGVVMWRFSACGIRL